MLEPDPVTAPVIARIFDEFVGGTGLYAIAEGLTSDCILSPSGHDRARNRHRASSRGVWSKIAVRAILQNPHYTDYQVWNGQERHEELIDVEDVSLGHVHWARCGRRMQDSWNHGRAYYRCKFPKECAVGKGEHPGTIYMREDALTPAIDRWVAQLFGDDHIEETCAALEETAWPDACTNECVGGGT